MGIMGTGLINFYSLAFIAAFSSSSGFGHSNTRECFRETLYAQIGFGSLYGRCFRRLSNMPRYTDISDRYDVSSHIGFWD